MRKYGVIDLEEQGYTNQANLSPRHDMNTGPDAQKAGLPLPTATFGDIYIIPYLQPTLLHWKQTKADVTVIPDIVELMF